MLLAIDTATRTASLALYEEHGVLGEVTWRTRENHTRSLMPELVRLMELVGTNADAIRAIGVATGPGSFTGLRIGLSAAKGLAYSTGAALIGVPTLEVAASMAAFRELPICAVIQAGRGRYAAALYENKSGSLQRVGEYVFGSATAIAAHLDALPSARARIGVIGEVDLALRAAIERHIELSVMWINEAANVRRAGFLGVLAWRRWRAGAVDDLYALAPYYIPTASLA